MHNLQNTLEQRTCVDFGATPGCPVALDIQATALVAKVYVTLCNRDAHTSGVHVEVAIVK